MPKEQALQGFGLTEAEVKLYLTLLSLGEATASVLAVKTSTNRTFTYDRLKKLSESGLVSSVVKDNKKYFKAAQPSQLLAILKEKEERIKEVLPELEKLQTKPKEGPNVQVFSSKKGIRTALNLVIKDKKPTYIHGSMQLFKEVMEEFYDIWNKRRAKEQVNVKVLSNEDIKLPFAEIDILPEEEQSSITTFTFGNKVIIALWSDVPVAILIENEAIAKDNITFFNNIWNREIKIYTGVDGIHKAFYELIEKKSKFYLGIGYSWALAQVYGRKMSDHWQYERLEKNIPAQLVSFDDKNSKKYFKERMKQWSKFTIRFLDKDICGPACVTLTEHKIATFIYTEKNLKVVVSKNKEMINTYKKHFEVLWRKAKNK